MNKRIGCPTDTSLQTGEEKGYENLRTDEMIAIIKARDQEIVDLKNELAVIAHKGWLFDGCLDD